MSSSLPLGPGALVVMGVYILSLLVVGAFAWSKRKENSLADFYLGGREMGVLVLLLTLYATQYSGNTLFGFSGAAYRQGLGFLVSVHFMTAIVLAYLLFAPRLFRLSREQEFITPGDFISYRFQSSALRIVITVIMIYVLANFTVAQMKTLGTAVAGISPEGIPMWVGPVGLALVMLVYESMGGMRSVAWTDVIQGGMLMIGFLIILTMAFQYVNDLPTALAKLAADPATRFKVEPPDATGVRTWLSFILMVGLGGAIYPQAIQRVYAAKSSLTLRRSLAVMGFLPLMTALIAVIVGVLMAAEVPDLGALVPGSGDKAVIPSETVLVGLCLKVLQSSDFGYWLVVILFAAILAAVMSTADSALLSISSMVTHDLYGRYLRPDAGQESLTRVGKWATWALMVPIVWTAVSYEGNLIQLLKIKFDLLLQCVPAFYLGVHTASHRLTAKTVLAGLTTGLLIALGLNLSGWIGWTDHNYSKVWGFHSGVVGLAANLAVCFAGMVFSGKKVPASRL